MPQPQYRPSSKTCQNVYCHSDGTTLNPEMRDYAWTGGHQECNSCHGHQPSAGGCNASGCHSDGRDGSYWNKFPEKKWLSAMPMYQNTGPLTDKANSHYRHLFTGFSCDDCHAETISGGGCLECHNTTIPLGNMTENQHINPAKHVNRVKNVVFKNGGSYEPATKTCSNTACHTGANPQWGGSVHDAVVCRDCHGNTNTDVDDFGKFNGTRAKINLGQWASNGHGRQGVIDPATGRPELNTNRYPSGNPPANFPDNGCWYCHDSQVLHQNEERPFRLIQHEHFEKRFEKECVFCHMQGQDSECLNCHNASESLAPQLVTISALPGVINPPYTIARPDHSGFTGGCSASTCHVDDAARHKTDAGVWTEEKKADVQNAYVQMGVCLICHDDDKSGECTTCHTGPQYALGYDPAEHDPGLVGKTRGRITAQKAKASSFHFGYKHYQDYENSLGNQMDSGLVNAVSTSTRELIDLTKNWTTDAFTGRRVTITSGANSGLSRPIVRNNSNTLTVAPPFPDGQQMQNGDGYKIMDIVWKGGKFCWDCHDPHGDNNIYMIQDMVATRTDGVVGKPIDRTTVSFTRKSTGLDYARIAPNPATGNYDGICNVCHTNTEMHYTSTKGDNHNSGRVCTECHEHRFTDSHASGQTCNTCHPNRPVPRHTGFSQARDCTKCHKDAIGARMNIMKQFSAPSHHVQTDKVTNKHCYACHWESTPEGVINLEHHAGYNYKTHTSQKDKEVDLVIWQAGVRPTIFDNDGANNNDTAASFLANKMDTTKPGNTLFGQRGEVNKVTNHCLGCHSNQNNDSQPFNMVDPEHGDCKTPRQYAWDRASIASRYSNPTIATLGKYTNANAAKKQITKAFSAHGNAVSNQGGIDPTTGVDGTIPNTRAGLYNIQCFDCHSSHGSMVSGITSSYTTFNGTKNGANLKETQAGKGGYPMSYMATANPNPNTVNPYQAGAGQCFDCHETANSNTQLSPVSKSPWGYNETFGATAPIKGYRDNPRFSGSYSGSSQFAAYRSGKQTIGGHFKASHKNTASPNYDMSGASDITAMGTIDGLCTPCHDPHGVSPSLGDKQAYALPMLKGTWLSSPYKEDGAPTTVSTFSNARNDWGGVNRPYPQMAAPQPAGSWKTDRNTFNQADLSVKVNQPVAYSQVSEDAETFAGLCLRCHPKNTLTTEVSAQPTSSVPWASVERIHRSVKGWGVAEGDAPREHSYTCSKCHQPHASGLPRLMQTNCLNGAHRGQVLSGGAPGGNNYGRFPYGWYDNGLFDVGSTSICHGAPTANGSSGWPNNQRWNTVTPWTGGQ
ncbi:MAG: CxxxxCH/CxxCH domain-containing protein [Desulfobulbaceae bacterium]|nr:CxxxxCH/CxxCH domain-containing protein [Desulfobulbaceae bacterium]